MKTTGTRVKAEEHPPWQRRNVTNRSWRGDIEKATPVRHGNIARTLSRSLLHPYAHEVPAPLAARVQGAPSTAGLGLQLDARLVLDAGHLSAFADHVAAHVILERNTQASITPDAHGGNASSKDDHEDDTGPEGRRQTSATAGRVGFCSSKEHGGIPPIQVPQINPCDPRCIVLSSIF